MKSPDNQCPDNQGSTVEGQSLQQKEKKRRKRKGEKKNSKNRNPKDISHFLIHKVSQNFDLCACPSRNVVKHDACSKKGTLSCCKCIFSQIKATLAEIQPKNHQNVEKRILCKKLQARSQWVKLNRGFNKGWTPGKLPYWGWFCLPGLSIWKNVFLNIKNFRSKRFCLHVKTNCLAATYAACYRIVFYLFLLLLPVIT